MADHFPTRVLVHPVDGAVSNAAAASSRRSISLVVTGPRADPTTCSALRSSPVTPTQRHRATDVSQTSEWMR
jgi:hypothetical protein